ncbi:MAG TPA: glutamine synthetase family protein [Thermoanaerobaculia bacterium]|jgi:glutamine synthetase|nr:glutamine synthetase family protein [Thermoanaerobaculia bacterium]
MTEVRGLLTLEELTGLVERGEIETVLAVFPDMYGRLMGKRITGSFFLEEVAKSGMHACDYLLACDMEMDAIPGYKYTSWETGYGDFHCVPDLTTLRHAAWLPQTALVLCDLLDHHEKPVEVSPRRMLQRQIERAREAGFTIMGGTEIELFVFDDSFAEARAKSYHDLRPMGTYNEDYHILQGTKEEELIGAIRRNLDQSGVPVEFSKGEAGLGQQEINLRYSEVLTQADRNVLYKHAAKEIAWAQGRSLTFMAKWDEKHTGSSAHVHVSLWDTEGRTNQFPGNKKTGPVEASDTFRWFLGGWLRHARALAGCWAPYVASYKRYQSRSWAPTTIAWSYDNRTAGFRVVGRGPSLRIECRIPGADANPYILYAAAIAAGLDGIQNQIEPPEIFQGDLYAAQELPRIPSTLREAITELENSELARQAFGDNVYEHYLHFLRTEQKKFDEVVTCWERARYFERA